MKKVTPDELLEIVKNDAELQKKLKALIDKDRGHVGPGS